MNENQFQCQFYDTVHAKENLVSTDEEVKYYVDDPRSCKEWYNFGARASGVYTINRMGRMNKEVRCNMEIEGGGWLVFYRRTNQFRIDFNRKWLSFKTGFGDIRNEFWLGNEFIHGMTSSKEHQVLVWGQKTDGVTTAISMHDSFKIGDETDLYRIYFNETSRKGIIIITSWMLIGPT